jgi:ribosomal protein S2
LKGLQNLKDKPDVLVILHAKDHSVAINEAVKSKVPCIGIVDSNANGLGLT